MLNWLLQMGFSLEEIKSYASLTNATLEELIHNTDVRIDHIIKHQIALELYGDKF